MLEGSTQRQDDWRITILQSVPRGLDKILGSRFTCRVAIERLLLPAIRESESQGEFDLLSIPWEDQAERRQAAGYAFNPSASSV